jgi:energy-converting hydrogenase Eha subunit G
MNEELDDPGVLKRILRRFALSTLAGFAAAVAGAGIAFVTHPIAVDVFRWEFFTGWELFSGLSWGALIFGVIGFALMWKRQQ